MEYSHIFGSNFPSGIISVGTKQDIDDSVKDVIMQYYTLMESGRLNDAQILYSNNKELLEPYMINMEYINRLEEEIYNIGLTALNQSTNIVLSNEPASQPENGFWYKEV